MFNQLLDLILEKTELFFISDLRSIYHRSNVCTKAMEILNSFDYDVEVWNYALSYMFEKKICFRNCVQVKNFLEKFI